MVWAHSATLSSLSGANCPSGPIFAEVHSTFPLFDVFFTCQGLEWWEQYHVSQSFPWGMKDESDIDTYTAIMQMLNTSQTTVDMAFYYFSLTDGERVWPACTTLFNVTPRLGLVTNVCGPGWNDDGGYLGVDVYNAIIAASKRGVKIRVVVVRCAKPLLSRPPPALSGSNCPHGRTPSPMTLRKRTSYP
jgi:hypothetical protein